MNGAPGPNSGGRGVGVSGGQVSAGAGNVALAARPAPAMSQNGGPTSAALGGKVDGHSPAGPWAQAGPFMHAQRQHSAAAVVAAAAAVAGHAPTSAGMSGPHTMRHTTPQALAAQSAMLRGQPVGAPGRGMPMPHGQDWQQQQSMARNHHALLSMMGGGGAGMYGAMGGLPPHMWGGMFGAQMHGMAPGTGAPGYPGMRGFPPARGMGMPHAHHGAAGRGGGGGLSRPRPAGEDKESSGARQPRTKRQRVLVACLRCRQRKRKCSGEHPCSRCVAIGCDCVFTLPTGESMDGSPDDERKAGTALRDLQTLRWVCGVGNFAPAMGSYVPLTKTAEGLPQRDLDAIEAVVSQYPDMPVVVDEKRFRDVVMAPAPAGTTKRHDQLALLGIVLAWGLSLRGSDASKPHFFAALSHLHASISNGEAPSAEGVQAANLAAAYSIRVELNFTQAAGLVELAARLAHEASGLVADHWAWTGVCRGVVPADLLTPPKTGDDAADTIAADGITVGSFLAQVMAMMRKVQNKQTSSSYEDKLLVSSEPATPKRDDVEVTLDEALAAQRRSKAFATMPLEAIDAGRSAAAALITGDLEGATRRAADMYEHAKEFISLPQGVTASFPLVAVAATAAGILRVSSDARHRKHADALAKAVQDYVDVTKKSLPAMTENLMRATKGVPTLEKRSSGTSGAGGAGAGSRKHSDAAASSTSGTPGGDREKRSALAPAVTGKQ